MQLRSISLSLFLFFNILYGNIAFAQLSKNFKIINLTNSNNDFSDPRLVIKKMTVKEISNDEISNLKAFDSYGVDDFKIPYELKANRNELNNVLAVVDKLIALGERLIPLIEKGRAVYKSKNMDAISVIPNLGPAINSLSEISNWSYPVTKHFKVVFENLYGIDVVSFVYSVTFQYGGNYDGKGKYLTGVRVATRDVSVMWGFDVDAHSELIQISNVGTSTNVIAGATIEISYTVGNVLNVISTSEAFHVTGDGRIFRLD
jgi:hypothetical protein